MPRRHFVTRTAAALTRALRGEAGAGAILIAAAAAALVTANSPLAPAYHALFHRPLAWTPIAALATPHAWIDEAAMAVFFFVVGLEIKRELLDGALSEPAQRRLPVLAAAAGMVVPAAIYLAVAGRIPGLARGWAIPAATDIAFAVGVLALLGRRIPPALRVFLLTVAIVDDLGAVLIIALFYSGALTLAWLAAAATLVVALFALGRWRAAPWPAFAALSVALWFAVLHSGIHPTVAGVLAALTIPLRPGRGGDSLLLRFEHALAPLSAYLIVPLFGFANAGVALSGAMPTSALPIAVGAGLALGKPIGICAVLALAVRSGLGALPLGASRAQLAGMALLCGIGFTMSLFIGGLAFPAHPGLVEQAKLGVLAGSLFAAAAGYAVLRLSSPRA